MNSRSLLIVKTTRIAILLLVLLLANTQPARATDVGGPITTDTTWTLAGAPMWSSTACW